MMKVKAHLRDYIRESFPSLSDEDQDICDLFIESINARWELSEAQMSLIKSVLTTNASHKEFSPLAMMQLLIFIRLYSQEKEKP